MPRNTETAPAVEELPDDWQYTDEWAAGFFDGEGCVGVYRRKRTAGWTETFVTAQVAQKIKAPITILHERFGGCLSLARRATGAFWYLRWNGTAATRFLLAIQPHSLVKRHEIDLALELRAHIGKPGSRAAVGAEAAKLAIYHRFQEECRGVALRGGVS